MLGEHGAGADQVLAVVQDQQRAPPAELGAEALEGGEPRREGEPKRGGGRVRHQPRVAEARQLDQPDAVAALRDARRRGLQGETGLARPAGARERDQAMAVEQPGDLAQLAVAPDEARQRDRQVVASTLGRRGPRRARPRSRNRLGRVEVDLAAQQRPIQARGLGIGLGLQLAPKRPAQPVILPERLLAATVGGEHPHQRAVGRLVQRVDDDGLLERLDRRRGIAVLGAGGRRTRAAAPGAPRAPRRAGWPPTPRSDPRRAARRRTARAPPDSPTAHRSRGHARRPPRRRRRRPPPARPETTPACRHATGAPPKPPRRPPPTPAGRRTAPDGSCWPPPRAPAQATTARSPAPDGLDAQAPARAASPGSWPYAAATRPRAPPPRRHEPRTRRTAESARHHPSLPHGTAAPTPPPERRGEREPGPRSRRIRS